MAKAYFIDVQGTLINDIDKKPIEGAIKFIDRLNELGILYVVITNNTKKTSGEFLKFLQESGFNIKSHSYLDPFMVLKNIANVKKIAIFGDDEFKKNMLHLDYEIVDNSPEAVIITLKKNYNNEDYASMLELSLGGAKLIGMHGTSIYAKDGKSYPGVGAILAMINYATKKEFEIVGKPSLSFYKKGLETIQKFDKSITFNDIEIISDDVIGDLVGAKKLGMKCTFVLSGKYKDKTIIEKLQLSERPDFIYNNIGEMLDNYLLS